MSELVAVAPVTKTIHVGCTPEDAFRVFTREIGSWWPTETHSLHPGEVREVIWEERVGGAVYDVTNDGRRGSWGEVLEWEPPTRFVIAWLVDGRPVGESTELEVRFAPDEGGTRVDLEHRHWERLGEGAASKRGSYDEGWDFVLGCYERALAS